MALKNQNPLDIPEILENVLKHLELTDLRQVRLVNTQWYLMSNRLGSIPTLIAGPGDGNLQQYLAFLNKNVRWQQWKLKYHIEMVVDENEDVTPFCQGLVRLQDIFGPSCVQALTIHCKSNGSGNTISYQCIGDELWNKNLLKMSEFLQKISLSFLKQLYIVDLTVLVTTQPSSGNLATLLLNIISSTSGLTTLSLKPSSSISRWSENDNLHNHTSGEKGALLQLLQTLQVQHVSNVQDLELTIGLSKEAVSALNKLDFPRLTSLKSYSYNALSKVGSTSTSLQLNVSRLISLELSFLKENIWDLEFYYLVMPNLRHFTCLQKVYETNQINRDYDKFEWTNWELPSLETFSTNLIYLLTKPCTRDITPILTGCKFSLSIDENSPFIIFGKDSRFEHKNQEKLLQGIQLIRLILPNFTELVVKNDHCLKDMNENLERNILKMMLENLSGIQVLRLENYNEDWLDYICKSSTVATENMQSIKQIIISPTASNFRRKFDSSRSSLVEASCSHSNNCQPRFDISTLLKHLPNLEMIQFPIEFDIGIDIGGTTITSSEQKWLEINKLRSKYTNLEIKLFNYY